ARIECRREVAPGFTISGSDANRLTKVPDRLLDAALLAELEAEESMRDRVLARDRDRMSVDSGTVPPECRLSMRRRREHREGAETRGGESRAGRRRDRRPPRRGARGRHGAPLRLRHPGRARA